MRDIITLQCTDCKERNYSTTKNKKKNTERLETKKFCRGAAITRCIAKRSRRLLLNFGRHSLSAGQ